MTGRRLYDHFCDSVADGRQRSRWSHDNDRGALPGRPLAWSFLTPHERRVWNDLAALRHAEAQGGPVVTRATVAGFLVGALLALAYARALDTEARR